MKTREAPADMVPLMRTMNNEKRRQALLNMEKKKEKEKGGLCSSKQLARHDAHGKEQSAGPAELAKPVDQEHDRHNRFTFRFPVSISTASMRWCPVQSTICCATNESEDAVTQL